jgi:hypothetical protein
MLTNLIKNSAFFTSGRVVGALTYVIDFSILIFSNVLKKCFKTYRAPFYTRRETCNSNSLRKLVLIGKKTIIKLFQQQKVEEQQYVHALLNY